MPVRKINKTDCVRDAVAELGPEARAKEICAFVLQTHGVEMSEKMASTYRATILRKGLSASRKKNSTPKRSATVAMTATSGGIELDEIRAVKDLADRLGAIKVVSLLNVLYS